LISGFFYFNIKYFDCPREDENSILSCTWNCYTVPFYESLHIVSNICRSTIFQKMYSQNSCLKDWEIVSDDIHPTCSINQTWIEPNNSTKPSITPTICNLSSLRISMSDCMLLAMIRLCSVPVSNMKTRSESNAYSSNRRGCKLCRIYYCDSAFSSSGSISWVSHHIRQTYPARARSRSVFWSRGISRVSRRIIQWIIVLRIVIFFNFVLCILRITVLFEFPFIFYYCWFTVPTLWIMRYGIIISLFTWILPAVIVSFISAFDSLRTVSGGILSTKICVKKYMPAVIRISPRALDSFRLCHTFWWMKDHFVFLFLSKFRLNPQ